MVHVGHSRAVVDCGVYAGGRRVGGAQTPEDALQLADAHDGFVWIGLHEPSGAELSGIARAFGLHPLAVEDAVKAHQRPKLERYGESWFLVLKTARYVEHDHLTGSTDVIDTGEVMVFVGRRFVVTVRHGAPRALHDVRAALEDRPDLLALGPFAVVHAVTDRVVDDYLEVAGDFDGDVDEVEAQVFSPDQQTDVRRVYLLKRELLELRRAVHPLFRPLADLRTDEAVPAEIRTYLRDVEDHLLKVAEQVTGSDELLNGILQANLAQVGVQQNSDMRKISAWVAVVAVPTLVAGIYGMNFEHMPELHWRYGYPAALLFMAVVCVALHRAFRRSGWL